MFISNDEVSDRLCKCCGYAENPNGWQVCALCGTKKSLDINNQFSECEVAHDIGIDNQDTNVLFPNDTEDIEKINQLEKELSNSDDYPSELQAKCDDLEKKVIDLKAQNNYKDECYRRVEEELNIIRNKNKQLELEIKSIENERNILTNQHQLYGSKLYSGLTFTVILFAFSAFIWFVYSELEAQQISQYNTSVLADKIADKWVTDLKSKSKQLKLSISDKDEQIGKLNKQIEDLNTLIKSKDTRIEQLDKSIIEKNKQVEEEKQKLKNLCNIANNKQTLICLSVN